MLFQNESIHRYVLTTDDLPHEYVVLNGNWNLYNDSELIHFRLNVVLLLMHYFQMHYGGFGKHLSSKCHSTPIVFK